MKKKMESWIDRTLRNRGYKLIPEWRLKKWDLANLLARLFDLLKVDCVIDVGANEGQYYDFLRLEVGFEGTIVCFEPIPELAARLELKARQDSRMIVRAAALGKAEGTTKFNITALSVFSSILTPLPDRISQFEGRNRVERTIECKVDTLANVISELGLHDKYRNIFLKLDTQGFDLEILKSCGTRIRSLVGIQTEVSFRPIYAGMPSFQDTVEFLTDQDFMLSGIRAIEGGQFPLLIEADCVMTNRTALRARGIATD